MKPNFLVIGAAKCGTSSLCRLIAQHPEGFVCEPKEPFIFSHDRNYLDKGWGWYESLFADAAGKAAVGEGSVTYTQQAVFPEAAPRIARDLPDTRLIYIARDPLEQVESHWMMLRAFWRVVWDDGIRVSEDFNEAVREAPVLLETARYFKQISWYRNYFADERILVLFFEDFRKDPDAVLSRCFEFLGIDPAVRIPDAGKPVNVASEHRFDRWFFKPMRLLPGASKLRPRLPTSLRAALRPLLRKPIGDRPQWSDETRGWVREQLAGDARSFLSRHGKPADFWSSFSRSQTGEAAP